ncbi:hypothetical protein [Reichenbachiella versicolor]|uniref:hypothetical protein n=1 Tax=Reichenbachiella versicolor TaxID=1821036 RepID=UPI000D6DE8D7|nr:hypothetical protein [Reichenbachiella versicolor]
MKKLVFILTIFMSVHAYGQDTLIMKDGRRIAFMKMWQYTDGIELKMADDSDNILVHPDSILGYWNNSKELSYFMVKDPDAKEGYEYIFTEREQVGAVSLFTTHTTDKMFALKGGQMVKIWDSYDRKDMMDARGASFRLLFSEDSESMAYLNDPKYKHSPKEISHVVRYYNLRNYQDPDPVLSRVKGKVLIYRTRFQKTKDVIKINNRGKIGELHINDFNVFEVPILQPLKLTFYDGVSRTDILISAEMSEQYFEVLYDKKTNGFRLDEKTGTELQYEFFGIRDKVQKKMKN